MPRRSGTGFFGKTLALVATAYFVASPPAHAQQLITGNIYGAVTDEQGAALPGVTVALTGVGAPQSTVTTGGGEYRFLNLAPGSYSINHTLSGFAPTLRQNVLVNVGRNVTVEVKMKLAGVTGAITVTSEAPLLDTRKVTTGGTLSKVELDGIPTAKDPWVVMQTMPGVLVDTVNVGGNQSPQQSGMVNKGATSAQTVWNVDGINMTDMASVGATATYYDFDSFEEIQVSTGGPDVTAQTPGVQMNMVTKRGTNEVHGSGRVLIADGKHWQADNTSDELTLQLKNLGLEGKGNRTDAIQDYGADMGGPILKDSLWLWGSYGRTQTDLTVTGGYTDKTTLENVSAKMNGQLGETNSATAFFFRGDKIKLGRNASLTRPPETTWNQSGPSTIYKLEDSQIFSTNFFASGFASYVNGGFALDSVGRGQPFIDESGVWRNGFVEFSGDRPQYQFGLNTSLFARTGEIGHEFKVGFGYRRTPTTSVSSWPGGIVGFGPGQYGDGNVAAITRDKNVGTKQYYTSAYVSDTITVKNLTVNAGLRYDYQTGKNAASVFPVQASALAIIPDSPLQSLNQPEYDSGFTWSNFEPRIGLTYAIDKKTLVRASYARFADQLGAGDIAFNTLGSNIGTGYIYYLWDDKNHNNRVDRGEVDTSSIYGTYNIAPNDINPKKFSPNKTDPNYKAGTTDEISLGFERELMPALSVSLNGTYRKLNNFKRNNTLIIADANTGAYRALTRADYEQKGTLTGTLPDGTSYTVPYYGPKAEIASQVTGYLLDNNPDYSQTYKGVDLQIVKRYENNWMARASISYNDWTQSVGANAFSDPTNLLPGITDDGGIVVQGSGSGSGARGGLYINSKWSANVSAMYGLPLGFNVAGNFFARQGYPIPYFRRVSPRSPVEPAALASVSVTRLDDERLNTVTDLDMRLEKAIKVGSLTVNLGLDVFNVFNSNTVLQRFHRLNRSHAEIVPGSGISRFGTNDITETQSPRIVRFGGRVTF